jgi:uncharacterized protein
MCKKTLVLTVFLLFSIGTAFGAVVEFGSLPFSEFYGYDKGAPLNPETKIIEQNDLYTLYSLQYDSVWGRRVPALYMVPKNGTPPYPAIIFGHGFMGNKDNVRPALDMIAKNQMSALSIDMWYHGDRKVEGKQMYSDHLYQMREGLALSVVDLRRAADFLQSRSEIDPGRIGYVGASMGGIIGGLFAAVDSRVQSPVLIVGGGDWRYLFTHSIVAQAGVGFTYEMSNRLGKLATRILAPVDPVNLVQLISPRPLLMINAKHDILVNPEANKKMFVRSLPPKKLVWFDSGHEVPFNDACALMVDWFKMYMVEKKPPDFESVVTGYQTPSVSVNENMKMAPIITEMSYNEYLNYDPDLPLLSFRDSIESENPNVSKYAIRYQSTHDRMVEGVLNMPTVGVPPYPVVIFLHDLGGTPEDADLFVDILARNGIASVSIGIFGFNNGLTNEVIGADTGVYLYRNLMVQSVQDTQRLIDLLKECAGILTQSLTVVGIGEGGNVAAVAAGVDDRIGDAVMIDTEGSIFESWKKLSNKGNNSDNTVSGEGLEEALAPVEAGEYVDQIFPRNITIFYEYDMHKKNRDYITMLYEKAKEPKSVLQINESEDEEGTVTGEKMLGLLELLWNLYKNDKTNADSENRNSGMFGLDTRNLNRGQNEWKVVNGAEGKTARVVNVNWMHADKSGGVDIIVNARVAKEVERKSTVVAIVKEPGRTERYLQLLDTGTGMDKMKNDGIYSGLIPIAKETKEPVTVTVGGIGPSGEVLIEKSIVIK